MDRHENNIFRMFCAPVSIGTSEGDKLLKLLSDSISDGVILQNFLGDILPDPPSFGMLYMPVCFTHYKNTYLSYPTTTMITDLAVPPFLKV